MAWENLARKMKILSIQEAYKRKFERQKAIRGLKYYASGHCVHIGKLSPGCYGCFVPDPYIKNFSFGTRCDLGCIYCPTNKNEKETTKQRIKRLKYALMRKSCQPNYSPSSISFSGGGEPLLYLDSITELMNFYRNLEKYICKRPWYYLYTNGICADTDTILKLQDLGFDELRFHLGASNFSRQVYKNIRNAVGYFKAITIETPSWPPHRKKLFEMLPIIEDIGVKHLNLGEIEINKFNYSRISSLLPKGEIYQCYEMHLDDGGLVYDIIEEVLRKKYSYSVLDCNCFVKSIQRSPAKWVVHQKVEGLCEQNR